MQKRFYKSSPKHIRKFLCGGLVVMTPEGVSLAWKCIALGYPLDLMLVFAAFFAGFFGVIYLYKKSYENLLLDSYGIKSDKWSCQIPWKVIDEVFLSQDDHNNIILCVNVQDAAHQLVRGTLYEQIAYRYGRKKGWGELQFPPTSIGVDAQELLDTIYLYYSNSVPDCIQSGSWCGRPAFLKGEEEV